MAKRKNTLQTASEFREYLLYEATGGGMGKETPKETKVEFSDKNKLYELMLKQSDIELKNGTDEPEESMFQKLTRESENGNTGAKRKKSGGFDEFFKSADSANTTARESIIV